MRPDRYRAAGHLSCSLANRLTANRSPTNLCAMPRADDQFPPIDMADMDPRSAVVFRALMRASRLHRQLMLRAVGAEGAHPGQAMILRILGSKDGLSQRELGDMLLLSKPTITAMLQRMERAGTIVREPDPDDQRITRVRLTAQGRRLDAELHAAIARAMGKVLDPLSQADRAELARLLDLVTDNTVALLEGDA